MVTYCSTACVSVSRLHKPVRIIQGNDQVSEMIQGNLESAATASLLLLPERFSAQEFYTTVAGLSYTGECVAQSQWNPRGQRYLCLCYSISVRYTRQLKTPASTERAWSGRYKPRYLPYVLSRRGSCVPLVQTTIVFFLFPYQVISACILARTQTR